jgi:hypothetical protein
MIIIYPMSSIFVDLFIIKNHNTLRRVSFTIFKKNFSFLSFVHTFPIHLCRGFVCISYPIIIDLQVINNVIIKKLKRIVLSSS